MEKKHLQPKSTTNVQTPEMNKLHHYACSVVWKGNLGTGTSAYRAYGRDHEIMVPGKSILPGSADPAFLGDPAKYNPEDLLLASLSSCHMLWFLHLCADKGIVVVSYNDKATGTMQEAGTGGHFTEVILRPHVVITDATRIAETNELHTAANRSCFIANSCNFPVKHKPVCESVGND